MRKTSAPDLIRGGSLLSEQTTSKIEGTAMNIQTPRPAGHQSWDEVRTRLDQNAPFSNMYDTPYYRDAVYDHFSKQEYQRRYQSLRDKMREHKLDCVIVPGGPSHWSFGGGMQWLTGLVLYIIGNINNIIDRPQANGF